MDPTGSKYSMRVILAVVVVGTCLGGVLGARYFRDARAVSTQVGKAARVARDAAREGKEHKP